MGHGVLKTCFRSVKIVSRLSKSCHDWYVRPKVRPTLSWKRAQQAENRVTFSQNRVTFSLQDKHAFGPQKSWHGCQIVSRFFTFPNLQFLSHNTTFSTLTLKWWWCHFNHRPPFSLTMPWTIPQDTTPIKSKSPLEPWSTHRPPLASNHPR